MGPAGLPDLPMLCLFSRGGMEAFEESRGDRQAQALHLADVRPRLFVIALCIGNETASHVRFTIRRVKLKDPCEIADGLVVLAQCRLNEAPVPVGFREFRPNLNDDRQVRDSLAQLAQRGIDNRSIVIGVGERRISAHGPGELGDGVFILGVFGRSNSATIARSRTLRVGLDDGGLRPQLFEPRPLRRIGPEAARLRPIEGVLELGLPLAYIALRVTSRSRLEGVPRVQIVPSLEHFAAEWVFPSCQPVWKSIYFFGIDEGFAVAEGVFANDVKGQAIR